MIAVVGAGAMGAALAILHARAGEPTVLLGTHLDEVTIEHCRAGRPHPALGIVLDQKIECRSHTEWADVLPEADRVVLAVSSEGLARVVAEVAAAADSALWLVATKGWDSESLRAPSEVVAAATGAGERVVVLAGPALAPELAAGGAANLVCASVDLDAAGEAASTLTGAGVSIEVTDDVAAAEVAAAYKNVTAIAVGICEGLGERRPESVYAHRFANARAAMFAFGLTDMNRLATARGGRPETLLGLAGTGDAYVTCLGGRNGGFGRLLGLGETPDQALSTIGSTVEGVGATAAALAIAGRDGVDLVVAPAVAAVLSGERSPTDAVTGALAPVT